MFCPHCGYDNLDSANSCLNCGRRLPDDIDVREPVGTESLRGTSKRAEHAFTIHFSPLGFIGIFKETFKVYRANFFVFLIMALIQQLPLQVSSLLGGPFSVFEIFPFGREFDIALIITVLVWVVSFPAAIHVVAQHYVYGRIDVSAAYGRGVSKFLYVLTTLVVVAFLLWFPILLSTVLIGLPLLFILLIRLSFITQAITLENMDPLGAIGRSWILVENNLWRTSAVGIIFVVIILVIEWISAIASIPISLMSENVAAIFSAVINVFTTPIYIIGATIVYLDLRARREDDDIEVSI